MKLLTLIQHNPNKRDRHLKLVMDFAVIGQTDNFSIVEDTVSSASGMLKCFATGMAELEFTHYLILQDDILPSRDLVKTAELLMELMPNEVISLFSASQAVGKALSINTHWATIDRMYGLCAYIIPAFMARDYVNNVSHLIKDDIRADDVRMSMYLEKIGKRAWITCPSLVEHIAWDRSAQNDHSVGIDNALKYRVANMFIGFEESGLSVDWKHNIEYPVKIDIGGKYDHIRHYKKL